MNGLFRRGGVWWARLAVPPRLRAAAGRREFVQSTRTYHLEVAKVVASGLLAAWRQRLFYLESQRVDDRGILKLVEGSPALVGSGFLPLEEAASATGLTRPQLLRQVQSGALALYYTVSRRNGSGFSVSKYDLEPDQPELGVAAGFISPDFGQTQLRENARRIDVSGSTLKLLDGHLCVPAIVDGDPSIEGFTLKAPLPAGPDELFFPDVRIDHVSVGELLLSQEEVETLRATLAKGVSAERIEAARQAIASERAAAAAPRIPGSGSKWAKKRFLAGVAVYCKDPLGLQHKLAVDSEIELRKRGLLLFSEFMGDLPFGEIDRDVLRQFIYEVLPTLPNKANNLPGDITTVAEGPRKSRKATMKEVVAALDARGWIVNGKPWSKMTTGARDDRRQWLCGLFKWAHEAGYIETDPAASFYGHRVAPKSKKGTDDEGAPARILFNQEQLHTIFGRGRFAGGGKEVTHRNGTIYPFEYWLPVLSLYGGLRIEEAAQLHLDDIACDAEGIWHLDINRKGEKALKNDNAVRAVPIHPELVRLGLIKYRDRLRAEGYLRLFPELTYEKASGYSGTASNKFSKLFESFGWRRDGTLVFHCFRHNANNALSKVDSSVLEGRGDHFKRYVQCKIMGHEVGQDANTAHYTHATLKEKTALLTGMSFDLPKIEPFDLDFGVRQVMAALQRKRGAGQGKESTGIAQWREPKRVEG